MSFSEFVEKVELDFENRGPNPPLEERILAGNGSRHSFENGMLVGKTVQSTIDNAVSSHTPHSPKPHIPDLHIDDIKSKWQKKDHFVVRLKRNSISEPYGYSVWTGQDKTGNDIKVTIN